MGILVVGLCLIPFLEHFIKGSYPEDINLYYIYIIFLLNSCISYFFGGYRSVILTAYQRLDIIQNISSLCNIVMYLIQIFLIFKYREFLLYIIVVPIFTIIINVVTAIQAKRMFPEYCCRGKVSTELKSDLKEKVSGLMVTKLCAITRNSFDSIFVSSFVGLSMAAIYANYYFILKALTLVLGIITQSILSGVGNSIQTETIEQNYKDLKRFNFIYLWISGVCAVCLLCLYQPFMNLWMGADHLLNMSSVVLFVIYFFLLTMGDMQCVYYSAAGLWWYYRKPTIIESVTNVVLNYVLGRLWGLNGIIIGTLLSLFIGSPS